MNAAFQYLSPPSACGYLPDQTWQLEYEQFFTISSAEYEERLRQGWRRFGHALFRPRCPACSACWSLRVDVPRFRSNRSQRRVRKLNEGSVELRIGKPRVTAAKLDLYDRFHAFQSEHKGWPEHAPKAVEDYALAYAHNPFPTQEWCYYLQSKLVAVGYVDALPQSLSAIYFFHDPDQRRRSLGTWNVLCVIDHAARLGLPHVYLGYFVEGCGSMSYKARFGPNEVLASDGSWQALLARSTKETQAEPEA